MAFSRIDIGNRQDPELFGDIAVFSRTPLENYWNITPYRAIKHHEIRMYRNMMEDPKVSVKGGSPEECIMNMKMDPYSYSFDIEEFDAIAIFNHHDRLPHIFVCNTDSEEEWRCKREYSNLKMTGINVRWIDEIEIVMVKEKDA